MGRGRPTTYTSEIAERVCKEVSDGRTLRAVCRQLEIPESTVREWVLDNREGFSAQYARAKELQVEAWADELREIADDGSNDWMTIERRDGTEIKVENKEVVNRSRLRVDTLKWLMSKITPRKYGDKIETQHSGGITVGWADSGQPKAIEPKS